MSKRMSLGAALALVATPALAHSGLHEHGEGLVHLLTEPDHMAMLAGFAALAVVAIVKRRAVGAFFRSLGRGRVE